jgi:hypothetical protein
MHPQPSAIFEFRELTKFLPDMSDRQQVTTLKFELFHALERALDFQDRSRAAESRLAELEARAAVANGCDDALTLHLRAEVARRSSDLEEARTQHNAEIRALRFELLAAETQCEALDELCRSLLVAIEQAAEAEDQEKAAASDVAAVAQETAS